jgi:arsenite methyltransferase
METNSDKIREGVRENYRKIVLENQAVKPDCCSPEPKSACCSDYKNITFDSISVKLGYSADELNLVPEGANLGLGCGNPQAIAKLKKGEVVVDLGSGAGFDVFLAAAQVGLEGKAVGVDMTHEMISKARENAKKGNFGNTEFRLGEIENLPVADNFANVVISNCVINLSPEKQKVFNESYRILKPGGRIAVSDVIAMGPMPESLKNDLAAYAGCISGALTKQEVEEMLAKAGFTDIKVAPKDESREFINEWRPGINLADFIVSANIEAVKPG